MSVSVIDSNRQSVRSNKVDSYCVFEDPAYRERYRDRFVEARKKGMDIVIYADGTIVLIENKISLYAYKWNRRRRDLERTKLTNRSSRVRRDSGYDSGSEGYKSDSMEVTKQSENSDNYHDDEALV